MILEQLNLQKNKHKMVHYMRCWFFCNRITNYHNILSASVLKSRKIAVLKPGKFNLTIKKCFFLVVYTCTVCEGSDQCRKNVYHVLRNINHFFSKFVYFYIINVLHILISGKANRITIFLYNTPQKNVLSK